MASASWPTPHGVALVGGDTTRGPLSITIAAHGFVPAGHGAAPRRRRRQRRRLGHRHARRCRRRAAAMARRRPACRRSCATASTGRRRASPPASRCASWPAPRSTSATGSPPTSATSCARSGVGAELDLGRLPTSRTLAEHFPDEATRWRLQLAGGDDYELCFTAAPANALAIEQALAACDLAATVVGRITREPGLRLLDAGGRALRTAAPASSISRRRAHERRRQRAFAAAPSRRAGSPPASAAACRRARRARSVRWSRCCRGGCGCATCTGPGTSPCWSAGPRARRLGRRTG